MLFNLPWNFKSIISDYQRDGSDYLEVKDINTSTEDESCRLVVSKHDLYSIEEIHRVLRKGGYFVTEQIGAKDDSSKSPADYNLENETEKMKKNGFRIVGRDQVYGTDEDDGRNIHRFYFIARKL